MKKEYITKDSGVRQEFASGMRRDVQQGKPNFSLLMAKDLPYKEQLITRWAELMSRGAEKYGLRNWEKASSEEELERFKSSAFRHFMQFISGEDDEDHAAATLFNINAIVYLQYKLSEEDFRKL
jgi:hypothetical protein